jgi:nucleoside-diphosphate-sugar epimerase
MGKIFFASSGEVYGKSAIFPTTENDYSGFSHLEPSGLYAESKRAAESYLYAHSEKYGYDVNSLRIYHTFGPGLQFNDKRIFGEVIQSIIFNTPFKWTSNGSVTRNFLYTLDLVRAILILAPTQGFEVFNVAGTQETKILDFVNIARQLSSSVIFPSVPPNFEDVGHTHIHRGFASIDKLASLNWQPTVNIDDAIKRTVRSQKWRISNNYTNL